MADYDLVNRSGTIADGSGGDLIEGDLAIAGGWICAIGAFGAEEVDAKGKIVTPGFVEVHTHYDGQCIWAEERSPSSAHGVTAAVMGNCGVGFAPCRKADPRRGIRSQLEDRSPHPAIDDQRLAGHKACLRAA